MKILYFASPLSSQKGVIKKLDSQVEALIKNGQQVIKTWRIENNESYLYLNNKKIKMNINNKMDRIKVKVYRTLVYKNILNFLCKNKNIDVLYIRYERCDWFFLNFLKKVKKLNVKIILEIPTYPYDKERKNIGLYIDKKTRKNLNKFVDRIVTYSEDKQIWKIPCINISNGIKLEKEITNKIQNKNKIVFTSVSNCLFWHGIDRFLYSLQKYGELSEKRNIIFNIVGEGSELSNLKKIVINNKYLSNIVSFKGFRLGDNLDKIYEETAIGVGSLARHRSGLYTMRALKNREYCAKGIPMIFSEDDPDLREVSFVYHVMPNEELIDIKDLIKWYDNMKLESKEIKEFAKQFSWDIQMKKVIDEIEKI